MIALWYVCIGLGYAFIYVCNNDEKRRPPLSFLRLGTGTVIVQAVAEPV